MPARSMTPLARLRIMTTAFCAFVVNPTFSTFRTSNSRRNVCRVRPSRSLALRILRTMPTSVATAQGTTEATTTQDDPAAMYVSPLSTRYASAAMRTNFGERTRVRLWRKLWIALAECEQKLGLEISDEQLDALRTAPDVDLDAAADYERRLRHDVMAHVHAFGDQAPVAKGIIHLGATSCFVTDNSDVMMQRAAIDILLPTLWAAIRALSDFAKHHRALATLGYTHLQPAQPTTVGKRACLWLQDLVYDALQLEALRDSLRLRGAKGTTGTQASFLALFDGDHEKVKALDSEVCKQLGFTNAPWSVTGQTYTRKQDFTVVAALAGIGQSAGKFANDLRILQHLKEVEEPFAKHQIGSSAMAYKRNPMRCERISALSRYLQTLVLNPAETASTQWMERTLDDSANRRLSIPAAFLTADAILQLVLNVSSALVVYPKVVARRLNEELPFMATENILMAATRKGGDRQALHEAIRVHSIAAGKRVKEEGLDNDLIQRITQDPLFEQVKDQLDELCDADAFVGRAPQQVDEYLVNEVQPLLDERDRLLQNGVTGDVRV